MTTGLEEREKTDSRLVSGFESGLKKNLLRQQKVKLSKHYIRILILL